MNTFFDKPQHKLITYKMDKSIEGGPPPYNRQRYETLDYVATADKLKNCMKNVDSDVNCNINTDHYPLKVRFIINLSKIQETGKTQNGVPTQNSIILMTVIFHDVHAHDAPRTERQRITGTDRDEVVYADDTICIAQTAAAINRLLAEIEIEGKNMDQN